MTFYLSNIEHLDQLREAFLRAINKITVKKFKELAHKAGCSEMPSDETIRRFKNRGNISQKSHELLRKFLFETPKGREMSEEGSFDPVVRALSKGNLTKPANRDVEGLYFAYHGSYLYEKRFAVRVIEIKAAEESLSVTDHIREFGGGVKQTNIALGSAVFFGNPSRLHIITNAETEDYRLGFSLFVAPVVNFLEPPGKKANPILVEAVGVMMGMNNQGRHYHRYCLFERNKKANETEEKATLREKMIKETGVFELAQLKAMHRKAIDRLRYQIGQTAMEPVYQEDPIFNVEVPVHMRETQRYRQKHSRHLKSIALRPR